MAKVRKVQSSSVLTFWIRSESEEEALEKCGAEFMEHVAGSADYLTTVLDEFEDGDPAVELDEDFGGVDFDLVDEE